MDEENGSIPGEIRASRFVLVDPAGKERGILEFQKGEPVLSLFGAGGRVQIQLGIGVDGTTQLFMENADITSFAILATGTSGVATLEFGASTRRIRASNNRAGENPSVVLRNDQNQEVGKLP